MLVFRIKWKTRSQNVSSLLPAVPSLAPTIFLSPAQSQWIGRGNEVIHFNRWTARRSPKVASRI